MCYYSFMDAAENVELVTAECQCELCVPRLGKTIEREQDSDTSWTGNAKQLGTVTVKLQQLLARNGSLYELFTVGK